MHQLLYFLASVFGISQAANQPWHYPPSGYATMTHYVLPLGFVGPCGCTGTSTHYPTAALSQLAFGSATAYGPGCGVCFNLTLLNTFLSNPMFFPPTPKSIIVKITDLCPSYSAWCEATPSKPNKAGHFLNFDLAFPSPSIPSDFFPSNQSLYGYKDFGVWNISYNAVPCEKKWAGASNSAALGSVPNMGDSVCCPADPIANPNTTCPSYSLQNGKPPYTTSRGLAVPGLSPSYTLSIVIGSLYIGLDFVFW